MNMSNETSGHLPADLGPEIDDIDFSDEALDRPLGMEGRNFACFSNCHHSITCLCQDKPKPK
jgi:hypothetical protein